MLIFIGIGMFAYFQTYPDRLDSSVTADGMLPYTIMHALPAGASGLLVTAIFAAAMSSVDSGINSLSTVIVNDWIKPWRRAEPAPGRDVALARWLTVGLGLLATLAAVYAARMGDIVRMWMRVMGLFAAPILSIFVLGLFTRRANVYGWLVGAACGITLTYVLQTRCEDQLMTVWHFPISFLVTSTIGYTASLLIKGSQHRDH